MVPSPVLSLPKGYEPQGVPKIKKYTFFFLYLEMGLANQRISPCIQLSRINATIIQQARDRSL